MSLTGFLKAQYGGSAAETARDVSAHFGRPNPLRDVFVASFTAKKIAPAGMFDKSGAVIPSKLPENNFGRLLIAYSVFGI